MQRVDLNCDTGEGTDGEADLMPHVTSANIACGGHAGDAATMRNALVLAARHGVAAGAHPGYPDRDGFGRRPMNLTPRQIYDTVSTQITALTDTARQAGVPIAHVKPHGALYNAAAVDALVARAIVRATLDIDPGLMLYGLAGSMLITEAEMIGLRAIGEAFADRHYECDGTLTPRGSAHALIADASEAADRVLRMVTTQAVRCREGRDLRVKAETVCIHGDSPGAPEIARCVRRTLNEAGVRVAAPGAP